MLVHNANLSRGTLFYIPGPLPGRKAEKKPRYLFLFFFSFSFSFLLFILSLSFIVKGAFLLKWWPTPYIKPIGNSIPVYTIRGPEWEVRHKYATSTGVVFSRFCPFSKIEYDFRGSHGDQDIGEPVVTSSSRIFNEYPPSSPREYATIATLHCGVNTADVEGFWCKNNNLFVGSYPVQSGLILACENIRFSSLFAAGDVSRFGSSPSITLSNTRKRYLG